MNPENNTPMQPIVVAEERAVGPAIGIIIIVLVLVLGGLYFWGQRMNKTNGDSIAIPQESVDVSDPQTEALKQQSSSDDASSIEADLQSTDVTNLGTETNSINAQSQRDTTSGY